MLDRSHCARLHVHSGIQRTDKRTMLHPPLNCTSEGPCLRVPATNTAPGVNHGTVLPRLFASVMRAMFYSDICPLTLAQETCFVICFITEIITCKRVRKHKFVILLSHVGYFQRTGKPSHRRLLYICTCPLTSIFQFMSPPAAKSDAALKVHTLEQYSSSHIPLSLLSIEMPSAQGYHVHSSRRPRNLSRSVPWRSFVLCWSPRLTIGAVTQREPTQE